MFGGVGITTCSIMRVAFFSDACIKSRCQLRLGIPERYCPAFFEDNNNYFEALKCIFYGSQIIYKNELSYFTLQVESTSKSIK